MFDRIVQLLMEDTAFGPEVRELMAPLDFAEPELAWNRLREVSALDRQSFQACAAGVVRMLGESPLPDNSLVNFHCYVQTMDHPGRLFQKLAEQPRALEILFRLVVGSQFLTDILLRNPEYLDLLIQHRRIAEFKHRQQFCDDAADALAGITDHGDRLTALNAYQNREILRISACDQFGLMDLKSVTVQLSLLADAIVQTCLSMSVAELSTAADDFSVIAFGKLGGEELNYSSDIDLVFLSDQPADRSWSLGQKLIDCLSRPTPEGFLYRVDMRLRPWGRSGQLVNSVHSHLQYLSRHGQIWEKQSLLKARCIAGNSATGNRFLTRTEPLIFDCSAADVRQCVQEMKGRIESGLSPQDVAQGDVKSGSGSIRDVEFVVQYLQLLHGRNIRTIRSGNTLNALRQLVECSILLPGEYRQLADGYVFLRTIEHSLQLLHYKQTHVLPESSRGLKWLSGRLDFPDQTTFLKSYEDHRAAIRRIFDRHVCEADADATAGPAAADSGSPFVDQLSHIEPFYSQRYTSDDIADHGRLISMLNAQSLIQLETALTDGQLWKLTIVGYRQPGDLSLICGLLAVHGCNIASGDLFTDVSSTESFPQFVCVLNVRAPAGVDSGVIWQQYEQDLRELMRQSAAGEQNAAQGQLIRRFAAVLPDVSSSTMLYPVEIEFDNESTSDGTVLTIRSEDSPGFLFELTNALVLAGVRIQCVHVDTAASQVLDTLRVTDAHGQQITAVDRLRELRATIVLTSQFTHLLPRSPDPENALLQFREFLSHLFQQPGWADDLASLDHRVLDALAMLLGVSRFLWEDFLRLQHDNLFPVLRDIDQLAVRRSREELEQELSERLRAGETHDARAEILNRFKDREMFRIDMRHILGHSAEFGEFSRELTELAEVVVAGAVELCSHELSARHGVPLLETGEAGKSTPNRLSVCSLGKCGGRELGYASDIELMFVYEGAGETTGPHRIGSAEFFVRLVELFTKTVVARQEGIFQIDLRLRPYGSGGPVAVSLDAFRRYFGPRGAAWPWERQALVKLRPIAGDADFGREVENLRDRLVYRGHSFDVAAMRGMREQQLRQLVRPGTFNAKLSVGGLVDCEYLVQGLQIAFGQHQPALRTSNTCEAIEALRSLGLLSDDDAERLQSAYVFLRRLISAQRVVRGHAKDLTVPQPDSEEFQCLARRMGYDTDRESLADDLHRATQDVERLTHLLDAVAAPAPTNEDDSEE